MEWKDISLTYTSYYYTRPKTNPIPKFPKTNPVPKMKKKHYFCSVKYDIIFGEESFR